MKSDTPSVIGRPLVRAVTGSARYGAEFPQPKMAHALLVPSTYFCTRFSRIVGAIEIGITGVAAAVATRFTTPPAGACGSCPLRLIS